MKKRVITALCILIVLCLAVLLISLNSAMEIHENETASASEKNTESIAVSAEPTASDSEPVPQTAQPEDLDDNARVIYLTFDDGPYMYTERLLDLLDEYDVKATFFVTGNYKDYVNLIGEEYRRGHSVGIHAYNHDLNTVYDDYLTDFYKMRELVYEQTGEEVRIFRFPGGSSNTIAKDKIPELINELSDDAFIYYDWDVDSCDATSAKSKDEVLSNLKDGVLASKKYSICLCHDVYDYTIDAVEEFIPWALENGFVFERLTTESPQVHHMLPVN